MFSWEFWSKKEAKDCDWQIRFELPRLPAILEIASFCLKLAETGGTLIFTFYKMGNSSNQRLSMQNNCQTIPTAMFFFFINLQGSSDRGSTLSSSLDFRSKMMKKKVFFSWFLWSLPKLNQGNLNFTQSIDGGCVNDLFEYIFPPTIFVTVAVLHFDHMSVLDRESLWKGKS